MAVVLVGVVLIILTLGIILQGTLGIDWSQSRALRDLSAQRSAVGVAGMPPMVVGEGSYGYAEDKAVIAPTMPSPMPVPGPGATPAEREQLGPRVISTASVSIRVDSAQQKLEQLRAMTVELGGFVAQSNLVDNVGVKTAYATIRMPSNNFETALSRIKAMAETVFNESLSADDVTDQFVDLEARLRAAKAEEQQYLQILQEADTVEDTLQVAARLGEVRSRIEQLEGQLRYLTDRTDYATISVTMTEETQVEVPTREWRPAETFRQAMRALVLALQGLADTAIAGAVFLIGLVLPIVLVIWLIVWIVRGIWRRMMRRS